MEIQQIGVNYLAEEDRLLLRVNTTDAQFLAVWLTRRLCQRLWPHLNAVVKALGVATALAAAGRPRTSASGASAGAPAATRTLMPEAAEMLHQAARAQMLERTDFSKPFDMAAAAQQPLGPQPLLATAVQLAGADEGALRLSILDARQRRVQLALTPPLAIAVLELMTSALRTAEWDLTLGEAAPQTPEAPGARLLN